MNRNDKSSILQDTALAVRLTSIDGTPGPKDGRFAITALGLSWSVAQPALDAIVEHKQFRKRGFVLVMTDVQPAWLVSCPHRVELLPTCETLGVLSGKARQRWIENRWTILRAKWDIRSEIAIGQPFNEFLSSQ